MSYKEYQNARDAAWQLLLDCGVDRLPVNLSLICRRLGVKVYRYQAVKQLPEEALITDGMTFFQQGEPVILYDQSKTPERIRFTVAHELGHLVLGHVVPGQQTTMNREPTPEDSPVETAANQFAARLLAPACVLWGLDLHTAEEIAGLCRISKQAAQFRAERMAILYERDKFLSSPLEQQVYHQFLPFIQEHHLRRQEEQSD